MIRINGSSYSTNSHIDRRTNWFGARRVRNNFMGSTAKRSRPMPSNILSEKILPLGVLASSFVFIISVIVLT